LDTPSYYLMRLHLFY